MIYVFEKDYYPNQTVLAEREFEEDSDAIVYAKFLNADYVFKYGPNYNPTSVYRK